MIKFVIALVVFALVTGIGLTILNTADNARRKRFKSDPIGWTVKYWIHEEEYYGKVRFYDEESRMYTITGGGEGYVIRMLDQINPLYKDPKTKV